jgi:hypothetical protein
VTVTALDVPAAIGFTFVERFAVPSDFGIDVVSFAPLIAPTVSFVNLKRRRTVDPRVVVTLVERARNVTVPSRPAAPVSPFGP